MDVINTDIKISVQYVENNEIKTAIREYSPDYDASAEFSDIISVSEIRIKESKPVFRINVEYDLFCTESFSNPVKNTEIFTLAVFDGCEYDIGNKKMSDFMIESGFIENYSEYDTAKITVDRFIQFLNNSGAADYVTVTDHAGLSASIGYNKGWDNTVVGIIYCNSDQFDCNPKKSIEYEIKTLNQWFIGDVYAVFIEYWDAALNQWVNMDSCSGFYDKDYMIADALNQIPENSRYILNDNTTCRM